MHRNPLATRLGLLALGRTWGGRWYFLSYVPTVSIHTAYAIVIGIVGRACGAGDASAATIAVAAVAVVVAVELVIVFATRNRPDPARGLKRREPRPRPVRPRRPGSRRSR